MLEIPPLDSGGFKPRLQVSPFGGLLVREGRTAVPTDPVACSPPQTGFSGDGSASAASFGNRPVATEIRDINETAALAFPRPANSGTLCGSQGGVDGHVPVTAFGQILSEAVCGTERSNAVRRPTRRVMAE